MKPRMSHKLCAMHVLETGGICITPRPSATDDVILPGMPMRPFFGIEPVLLDSSTPVSC